MSEIPESEYTLAETVPDNDHSHRAHRVVRRFALGSLGVGLVPLPAVDLALLATSQLSMLRSLAEIYDVEFSKEKAKAVSSALVAGGASVFVSNNVALVLLSKLSLPIAAASIVSGSVLAGASTYALGRVFVEHFESGGTFLTMDPEQTRSRYQEQFEKGKKELKSYVGIKP